MKHVPARWIISAALVLGILLVKFWLLRPHDRPVPPIPEYPHRADLVVQDEWHPYFFARDEVALHRTTTFRTADSPVQVFDFYWAQMTQHGWPLKLGIRPEELRFEFWLVAEPVAPPDQDKFVTIAIVITATGTRQTEVLIEEQHGDGRRAPYAVPLSP